MKRIYSILLYAYLSIFFLLSINSIAHAYVIYEYKGNSIQFNDIEINLVIQVILDDSKGLNGSFFYNDGIRPANYPKSENDLIIDYTMTFGNISLKASDTNNGFKVGYLSTGIDIIDGVVSSWWLGLYDYQGMVGFYSLFNNIVHQESIYIHGLNNSIPLIIEEPGMWTNLGSTSPVPIPTTLLLVAFGLLGLRIMGKLK